MNPTTNPGKTLTQSKIVLALGTVAVLLIGGLLLSAVGSAEAAHAQTVTEPMISSIVATPTQTGASIAWNTDENSNSQVQYGTTASYGNSTGLDTAQVTSHLETLSGLTPNTTYHFEVMSTDASSSMASSSDMTFTTMANTGTTTTASTTEPMLSTVLVSPTDTGATVTWNTDENANSQVQYGTTASYGNSSGLDTAQVMNHSVVLSGLTPNTLYHFQVWSTDAANNTASSTDFTFMTTDNGTGTTTGGMTIDQLQAEITALQAEVASLENTVASWTGTGTTTTTPPPTGPATIDQNNSTVTAGGAIDLSGRNFGHEENVTVALNGNTVATAHADGGGNFSTGSFAAPTTPGPYVYTFTGQTSGDTATATITVQ